ncbi:transglycosylase SLT domain-containing protein [Chelatococcus sp. XZ-Ab1]|uniref:transglycosylase SLT domain-containing protein n=1 Tax=Chelatococcus sp. XZ-Ab1 TaxID=3034027 RepID=UPI0023E3F393|nr:transglycosylase SLT domain-containing protein [Chelatococcus sp. XZ-Ab1]
MVDAFEASGAGRVRQQLTDIPSTRDPHVVSVDQLTRPYTAIAEAVGHFGRGLSQAADDLAAYNAMAHQTAFVEAQVQIDKDVAEARAQYRHRPAEFEAWAKEYGRTVGKGSPVLRDKLRTYATQVAGNEFSNIVNEKRRYDEQTALATLKARREDVESRLEDIVFRGADKNPDGTPTHEYAQLMTDVDDIRRQMVGNPNLAYSEEMAALDAERFDRRMTAMAIVGSARRDFERDGNLSRVQRAAEERLNGVKGLSAEERLQYLGLINRHLSGANAARSAITQETKERGLSLRQLYRSGQKVPDAETDAVIEQLRRYGLHSAADDLEMEREASRLEPAARASARGAVDALAGLQGRALGGGGGRAVAPGRAPPPEIATAIGMAAEKYGISSELLHRIAWIESRFDPNALNPNSKAAGPFQFIPSTWRQYGAGASPHDPIASADAAARLLLDNKRYLERTLGRTVTDGELYLAHQQGAGGAAKLLSNPNARAVDVVGWRAVTLNGGTPEMTAGQFAQLWIRKVEGAEGATFPAAGGTWSESPVYHELLQRFQGLVNDGARQTWAGVKSAFDGGFQPSPAEMEDLLTYLPKVSDANLRKEILDGLAVAEAAGKTAGLPVQQLREIVAQSEAAAARGEVDPLGRQLIEVWNRQAEARARVLREEPTVYGKVDPETGIAVPQPLDLSSGDALRTSIAERQRTLEIVKQGNPDAADAVFSRTDIGNIVAALKASPESAPTVIGEISGALTPAQLGVFMANEQVSSTLAGMARSGDPQKMSAAFSILDAEYRRDPQAFERVYGRDVETNLRLWQDRRQYMTPDQLVAEMKRAGDPTMKAARDALRKEAQTLAKDWTVEDVRDKLGHTGFLGFGRAGAPTDAGQAGTLRNEFVREFADAYAETGDEKIATGLAAERVNRVWGPSAVNGGEIMRNPPEKFYPTIGGSHEWIAEQLEQDVRRYIKSRLLTQTVEQRPGETRQEVNRLLAAPHRLIADQQTDAERARGEPPSYQIVVRAPDGRFVALEDAEGRPTRFRADASLVTDEMRRAFEQRRQGAVRAFERGGAMAIDVFTGLGTQ